MSGRLTGDPGCCIFTDSYSLSSPSSVFVQPANDGSLKVIACCSAACPIGASVLVMHVAALLRHRTRLPVVSRKQATTYLWTHQSQGFAMHEACKLSLGACML